MTGHGSKKKISEEITVGDQPTEEELRQLAQDGYKAVVNLRVAGENNQPISPKAEGAQVRELGMQYLHIPVSMETMETMEPRTVDRFRQEVAGLPSPVLVHCHQGMRAGALVMMQTAIESGISGEETLHKAAELGFQCDRPQLKQFVKGYIDRNKK